MYTYCTQIKACLASSLVGSQTLPRGNAAGCCLAGPDNEVSGCGNLGGPQVTAGLLVGRARVVKTLGLLPTHWEVKPGPGVSTRLLAGRADSWSLAAGHRDLRTHFRPIIGDGEVVPDTVVYGVNWTQLLFSH